MNADWVLHLFQVYLVVGSVGGVFPFLLVAAPFPCKGSSIWHEQPANGQDNITDRRNALMSEYQQPSYRLYCVSLLHTPRRQVTPALLQSCSTDRRPGPRKRVLHVSGGTSQFTASLLLCVICKCCWRADQDKKWTVRRNIGRTKVYLLIFHFYFFLLCNQEGFCGQALKLRLQPVSM